MASHSEPTTYAVGNLKNDVSHDDNDVSSASSIDLHKEAFDVSQIDPILARKMALVNDAIEAIGMTPFQWKLFFLNGFGYAVDSVGRTPGVLCNDVC